MKILFIAPYIYDSRYDEHSKNKTGFGFMVSDIAFATEALGNEVIITTHAFGPERKCGNVSIAKNSIFYNIIYGRYKGCLGHFIRTKKNAKLKETILGLYYYLNLGYLKRLIKKENPDIVHVHGCSIVINEMTAMFRELGVKYVVTLHGLLDSETSGASPYLRDIEREFIKNSRKNKDTVTVISSRMEKFFSSQYYDVKNTDNVYVVTNGVNVSHIDNNYRIREKHGITKDKKVILCIGSICENKNQKQIVQAFNALPQELKEDCVVFFVGTIRQSYSLDDEIAKYGLSDKVICTGFVPREELHNYYADADITVVASIVEGFGLSMIEGFVYGVPCVAYADLAAIPDIYNEEAMILCEERSEQALAMSITEALTKKWDKNKIMNHSQSFSLEEMSRKYQIVYEDICKQ